ncbi:MAG: VOC family protein [Acidobacteria bacterium]|nr:VOC family protein [Acidobacteriota bacterium]
MATVQPIPSGVHTVTPNLTIRGCASAIDFYKRALGAEELNRFQLPGTRDVWHAQLHIGDSNVFVNEELPGSRARAPSPDRPSSVSLWLYVGDCDASYRRALGAGAKSSMEPADQFWGDRIASVIDPFGYLWTFATHVKDMTEEEMRRAGEEFARSAGIGY